MASSPVVVVVIVFTALLLRAVSADDGIKQVYLSLIYSGGEYGYRSEGGIPAIDIALEAIEDQQLLPGYNLTYDTPRNSKVYFILHACE